MELPFDPAILLLGLYPKNPETTQFFKNPNTDLKMGKGSYKISHVMYSIRNIVNNTIITLYADSY